MGHCAVKYSGNNDSVTSYVTSLQHKVPFSFNLNLFSFLKFQLAE